MLFDRGLRIRGRSMALLAGLLSAAPGPALIGREPWNRGLAQLGVALTAGSRP
jgi:hypothetical protein